MAVKHSTSAQAIGRAFAKLLRGEASARRLAVRAVRDYVEVWLLTEPIDGETERRLYNAGGAIHDHFPEARIRFHVVNPRHYEDSGTLPPVPDEAEDIPLRS